MLLKVVSGFHAQFFNLRRRQQFRPWAHEFKPVATDRCPLGRPVTRIGDARALGSKQRGPSPIRDIREFGGWPKMRSKVRGERRRGCERRRGVCKRDTEGKNEQPGKSTRGHAVRREAEPAEPKTSTSRIRAQMS